MISTYFYQFIDLHSLLVRYHVKINTRRFITTFVIIVVFILRFTSPLLSNFSPFKLLLPLLFTEHPGCLHAHVQTSLVPTILTVLPGSQSDTAVSGLDTAVGEVVSALDGSSEECSTRRTDLSTVVAVTSRVLATNFTRTDLGGSVAPPPHWFVRITTAAGFRPRGLHPPGWRRLSYICDSISRSSRDSLCQNCMSWLTIASVSINNLWIKTILWTILNKLIIPLPLDIVHLGWVADYRLLPACAENQRAQTRI